MTIWLETMVETAMAATMTIEVAEENPFLYHEIQYFNTYTDQMLKDLNESLAEFCEAARAEDGERFHALMEETSRYLKL